MSCLEALLSFGFMSTHEKLQALTKLCTTILSKPLAEEDSKGAGGSRVEMAKSAIDVLMGVADLRVSYRLAKLLFLFKQRAQNPKASTCGSAAYNYLTGATKDAQKALGKDFENLFTVGQDDSADLDLKILGNCGNVDELLMKTLLQPDDDLFAKGLKVYQRQYGQRKKLAEVVEDVVMLPSSKLVVFDSVHRLRVELNDLVFFLSTYSSWGVCSLLSGPFGDKEFTDTMACLDRLLRFIHTKPEGDDASSQASARAADNRPRSFVFKHVDRGDPKETYEHGVPLWEVDVAAAWAPGSPDMEGREPVLEHQNILRSLNLQGLLTTVAMGWSRIDPLISYKGSVCSAKEKVESHRRLSLVHTALLRLAAAFSSTNRANQNLFAPALASLEELAAPSGADEDLAQKSGLSSSTAEIAQAVVQSILRRNEALAEHVRPTLVEHFADLANAAEDPSTSPALNLFFIACKPEGRALVQVQGFVVEAVLHRKRKRLAAALKHCLRAAVGAVSGTHANRSGRSKGAVAEDAADPTVSDPARLLRLMRCLVEGGNEYAWQQLSSVTGVSLESGFKAMVEMVTSTTNVEDPETVRICCFCIAGYCCLAS